MRHLHVGRRGLTLIELIVALLVLQIVLIVLVQTVIRGMQAETRIDEKTRAALVAQAVMDGVIRNPAGLKVALADPGTYPDKPVAVDADLLGLDPQAVQGFEWQTIVARYEGSDALREVTVSLSWKSRERTRRFNLVSVMSVPTQGGIGQ
ncbi:MAG: type II secretion system protein [Candidatus Hydrogenedentes bacterium]|nr:type II secretion system protein [Candidatus Hydrogenedentota bacterium]